MPGATLHTMGRQEKKTWSITSKGSQSITNTQIEIMKQFTTKLFGNYYTCLIEQRRQ